MLERELFASLEQTADATYSVTTDGAGCSVNAAAAPAVWGHSAGPVVLARNIDDVFKACDSLGTDALLPVGREAATRHWDGSGGGIANFDLEVATKLGERIWVNVSTIVFDSQRTGRRLFVRLARDMTQRRNTERSPFTDRSRTSRGASLL